MKDLSHITITTKRLKLVPISSEYAPDIFKEFTEEITTYMFPRSPQKIEETIEYIQSVATKMKAGKEFSVVIINKKTGVFLGAAGVHKLTTDTPELGIWIKKSAHGHKFGQEAVTALKEWTDKNIDYHYIKYPVDKRNIPSRKIAESLGGVIKAEYQKMNLSGNVLDEVEYRIYRS